jgi:histidine triad (HIT) family protein
MNDPDCIFCKIISGEIPSDKVYEDETLFAFKDIQPVAPVHILIVPKKHIPGGNEFSQEDEPIAGKLFSAARKIAAEQGVAENGYRMVVNTGDHGRQSVHHLHLHLIGGKRLEAALG